MEGATPLDTTAGITENFGVGTHTVTLTVTDNHGATASDDVVVTVNANEVPVADAGPDQILTDADGDGAEPVILDGSGSSDSDGILETFEWTEGANPLGSGVTINPELSVGIHTITLTVTDNGLAINSNDLVVTVSANQAPVADAGPDQTVTDADGDGAEPVILDGSGSSDSDGILGSFEWTEGANPLGSGVTINPDLSVGIHTITLTVTDNGLATNSNDVVVIVDAQPSTPPQTKILAVRDGYDDSGETTLVEDGKVYTVQDIDGDAWETEALYFTSYSFESASLSPTENIISVKIELTHYEESEFAPGQLRLRVGTGPLTSPGNLGGFDVPVVHEESQMATFVQDVTSLVNGDQGVLDALKVVVVNDDDAEERKTITDRIRLIVEYR